MGRAKHIATYPLYGTDPISGRITRKRIGTGFVYDAHDIAKAEKRLGERGHPVNLRWRNEQCRREHIAKQTGTSLAEAEKIASRVLGIIKDRKP